MEYLGLSQNYGIEFDQAGIPQIRKAGSLVQLPGYATGIGVPAGTVAPRPTNPVVANVPPPELAPELTTAVLPEKGTQTSAESSKKPVAASSASAASSMGTVTLQTEVKPPVATFADTLKKAQEQFAEGNYLESSRSCIKAIELDPKAALPYFLKAQTEIALAIDTPSDFFLQYAGESIEKGLALDPSWPTTGNPFGFYGDTKKGDWYRHVNGLGKIAVGLKSQDSSLPLAYSLWFQGSRYHARAIFRRMENNGGSPMAQAFLAAEDLSASAANAYLQQNTAWSPLYLLTTTESDSLQAATQALGLLDGEEAPSTYSRLKLATDKLKTIPNYIDLAGLELFAFSVAKLPTKHVIDSEGNVKPAITLDDKEVSVTDLCGKDIILQPKPNTPHLLFIGKNNICSEAILDTNPAGEWIIRWRLVTGLTQTRALGLARGDAVLMAAPNVSLNLTKPAEKLSYNTYNGNQVYQLPKKAIDVDIIDDTAPILEFYFEGAYLKWLAREVLRSGLFGKNYTPQAWQFVTSSIFEYPQKNWAGLAIPDNVYTVGLMQKLEEVNQATLAMYQSLAQYNIHVLP